MTSKSTKALQNHYKQRYIDCGGHEHFWAVMDPNDVKTWYILYHDMGADQPNAEYLMRMTATDKYPFDPPKFELFTPNPRYEIGKSRPCLSIGEYHANDYPALLGMIGFAIEVFGTFFMSAKDLGGGISLKTSKTENSKQMAEASRAFNETHYPQVMELFKEERKRVFVDKIAEKIEIAEKTKKSSKKVEESESSSEEKEKKKVTKKENPKKVKPTKKIEELSDEDVSESSTIDESDTSSEEIVVKKKVTNVKNTKKIVLNKSKKKG